MHHSWDVISAYFNWGCPKSFCDEYSLYDLISAMMLHQSHDCVGMLTSLFRECVCVPSVGFDLQASFTTASSSIPLNATQIYRCTQAWTRTKKKKKKKKTRKRGSFFSRTHKRRFVFRGLKMLFFKKKREKGVFFFNLGIWKSQFSRKKGSFC